MEHMGVFVFHCVFLCLPYMATQPLMFDYVFTNIAAEPVWLSVFNESYSMKRNRSRHTADLTTYVTAVCVCVRLVCFFTCICLSSMYTWLLFVAVYAGCV